MTESAPPPVEREYGNARVRVENVGGIDRCSITLSPGVTILTGRNATNRTSFLTALADVLGGPSASLKSDAESGRIELELDGQRYAREYSRREGTLVSQGTQFTDRGDLIDLFAQVLEDNPARRAVERGEDLRDLIMRPVDTDEIEREMRERKRERNRIEERIEEIETKRNRLPGLEERRRSLEANIEEMTEEIEATRERIEQYEATEEETRRGEELLEELEDRREALRTTERRIADREDELARLESNLEEVTEALAETSVPEGELERIDSELEERRRRKRDLAERIENLERVLEFNEELLAGDTNPLEDDPGEVTDALDPASERLTCWTCGTAVERGAIEERLDEIREVLMETRTSRRELEAEIEDLEERHEELARQRDSKREMENQRERLERQIEFQRGELADLRERRDDLRDELANIEKRVEETEELRESDLIEAYGQVSELEYERGKLESELERVEEEIEEREGLAEERDRLADQREEVSETLSRLRSRIDDLEADAIEQFNSHMAAILDLLEYENLTRVWLERVGDENASFELHIVRHGADDAVYEDVVDNLSESEREVVGLVVALAGYLVHDVHEVVPFMLLDSLEAIDSERIADLVAYFRDYVPFLVVALLPEDASALEESYDRIPATEI